MAEPTPYEDGKIPVKFEEEEGEEVDEEDEDDLFKQDDQENDEEEGEEPEPEPTGPPPSPHGNEGQNDATSDPRHKSRNEEGEEAHPPAGTKGELSIPRKFVIDRSPTEDAEPVPAPVSDPAPPPAPATNQDHIVEQPQHKNVSSGVSGASYGLPQGAIVPASVDPRLLEGRLLETLRKLPAQLINDALVEYDDAIHQKQDQIRNHGAYLYGVIKRYVSVQQRGGEGSMGSELTRPVQDRLVKLVQDGFCTQEEMNDKVKSKIRMLSEKDALFAIEELAGVERSQIRNFGSYFMGILNRYMRGEKVGGKGREQKSRNNNKSYDHYGASKDERRFSSRSRSPDRDARRRSRYEPDKKYDPYTRDRSRDRFDEYRSSVDRSHYDPRQQQHQQFAQVPPPPPPRPYGQQAPNPVQGAMSFQPPPVHQHYVPQQGAQQQQQQPPRFQPAVAPPGSSFPGQIMHTRPQQPMMANPPHPSMGGHHPHMQQQQQPGMIHGVPTPAAIPGQPGVPAWQQPQQPPPDILGIADKAAQALAASQNILGSNMPHLPQPQPGAVHQQQAQLQVPMQHQPQNSFNASAYSSSTPQHQQPQVRRGRTTAKIHELPVTVQFAVQNLQETGHVNGPLDEGILGMIKDLPEGLALQALNKFSTIDQSTMRNKTAYLAGVLRRELEKIARR